VEWWEVVVLAGKEQPQGKEIRKLRPTRFLRDRYICGISFAMYHHSGRSIAGSTFEGKLKVTESQK